jgi:uncharacterized protein YecE (DUF72 family)
MARVRIGIAGWDYEDWVGTVYPTGSSRRFDRLAYVCRFVDVIEINSTFYRPAAPRTAESWLRRTEGRGSAFTFTAKLHRSWTHDADTRNDRALLGSLDGLDVLRDAGKLAGVLAQFPQAFHHGPRAMERLSRIVGLLVDWPLVVEVRHAGWQTDEARRDFDGLGAAWCVVDQPRVGRSTAGPEDRVTAEPAYLRLHGRNSRDWFREGAGRDARYDYLYRGDELTEVGGVAKRMSETAEELIVVQNNHFRGQALVSALQLKHRLQGQRPIAPETLVAVYPDLAGETSVERTRLF